MSRFSCAALVVLAFTGWAVCAAQETVTISGVELSADCALARQEHPQDDA
jgi:hypothetical protein